MQICIILQHRSISAIVNSELRLQKGVVRYRVIARIGTVICLGERYSVIQLHPDSSALVHLLLCLVATMCRNLCVMELESRNYWYDSSLVLPSITWLHHWGRGMAEQVLPVHQILVCVIRACVRVRACVHVCVRACVVGGRGEEGLCARYYLHFFFHVSSSVLHLIFVFLASCCASHRQVPDRFRQQSQADQA